MRTISLKTLNEELLLRNQQLDAIVATAPDIIFSSEGGGDRDYISERFYEYTGAAPGAAIGMGWLDYIHPEDVSQIQNQWLHCVQNGNQYESEYRIRGRAGEYRWFRARAIPLRDSTGSITKWCGTCADIHDQRLLETSFRENAAFLEKTVQERTDALRRLSGRLMTLQEEERRRIARELHDSVGQELAAAKMNLDRVLLAEQSPSPITVEAVESLQRAIQQVRTISHLLYPPLLDEVGLTSAVRWYLEGLTARSGIQISFHFTPKAFPRLTRELETAAFRIIQEAMTNLYRHSEATEGTVSLEYQQNSILVRVLDNGKGLGKEILRMEASALGVGLGGMKQRVEELGGTLRLSDAMPGTIVEADIPLSLIAPARGTANRPEVAC
jgi:PAS domain S-box-containing protein